MTKTLAQISQIVMRSPTPHRDPIALPSPSPHGIPTADDQVCPIIRPPRLHHRCPGAAAHHASTTGILVPPPSPSSAHHSCTAGVTRSAAALPSSAAPPPSPVDMKGKLQSWCEELRRRMRLWRPVELPEENYP